MAEDNSPHLEQLEGALERQEEALESQRKRLESQREGLEELRGALQEQRAAWEERATGFYFEIAKHLATLSTAAILVFLAVASSGEVSLPLWVSLLFVGSLAGATVSMLATGLRGISSNRFSLGNLGMAVAVASFFLGLLYSVLHALLLP